MVTLCYKYITYKIYILSGCRWMHWKVLVRECEGSISESEAEDEGQVASHVAAKGFMTR